MSCTGISDKALTRRMFLGGLACVAATAATQAQAAAPHILRGAGDFRRITLNNWRTGEWHGLLGRRIFPSRSRP